LAVDLVKELEEPPQSSRLLWSLIS